MCDKPRQSDDFAIEDLHIEDRHEGAPDVGDMLSQHVGNALNNIHQLV